MSSLLPLAIGLVAMLYASVGHAGATGYIAVLTLLGLPAATTRPTALMLNVIAATIATAQFFRAGHFRPRLFWPLAAASVPCAFVGGAITTSDQMQLNLVSCSNCHRIHPLMHVFEQNLTPVMPDQSCRIFF